jgi:hypothetical protein
MSGLFRSARLCVAALLTTALVLGVNGFEGAIHSVHHLPAPPASIEEAHAHDYTGHGHGEQGDVPDPGTQEPCSIAAAASHASAASVEPPAALAPVPIALELVTLRALDPPRTAWREPGSGRAPPSIGRISS